MKINNETKVGLLAIIAVALLVLGFNFLKGNSLFKKTTKIFAVFPNLGSLDNSNQVKINGLPIGSVYDFTATDKEVTGIVVTINLTRDVNIPKNSIAHISSGLVGASTIVIAMGNANEYLKNGDTIATEVNNGILGDLTSQVSPTLSKTRDAIDSLTVLIGNVNTILDPHTKNNLQTLIRNLTMTSAQLQQLLSAQSGVLAGSLKNLNDITGNLAQNGEHINKTIQNLETASGNLASVDLQTTMDSLNSTVNNLKTFTHKLNGNDGTLGLLMNDKTLYNNINYAIIGLETLVDDIRVHPKRYVNISVFGGKNKGAPITSPEIKDTIIRIK
jgi:phospholipid/cholesterol/gamma-HCH transport system substrate-binding protein